MSDQQMNLQQAFALVVTHVNCGQLQQAKVLCEQIIAQIGNHPPALNILAVIAQQQGQSKLAIDYLEQAISLSPDMPYYYNNLGGIYKESGQLVKAEACFSKALSLDTQYLEARKNSIKCHEELCDWSQRDIEIAFMLADLTESIKIGRKPLLTPLHSLSFPCDPAQQLATATLTANEIINKVAPMKAQVNFIHSPRQHRRLRIGYLSKDFRHHPTGHLSQGLFREHDQTQFEVFSYFYGYADQSCYYHFIQENSEHFATITDLSYVDAASKIYQDNIDILVDMNGHIQGSRPEILALQPAPIQVNFIGYPGTQGAEYIDYNITDGIVTPENYWQYMAEKQVLMPYSHRIASTDDIIDSSALSRTQLNLPEQGIIFCCFNSHYKIEPTIFKVWMRILAQVPGSILWLLEGIPEIKANLQQQARMHGIDPERLKFTPRSAKATYLAKAQIADLFLDAYYVNAHTTATDMLWAGLPILCCYGDTFASRIAASVLSAANLSDCVCENLAVYEAKAIDYANHPQKLTTLKQQLWQNRLTCPLFDTAQFVRNLETAYTLMWDRYCRGLAPDHLKL